MIGKIGTDIQDNKCSWLVVQALQRAQPPQVAVLKARWKAGTAFVSGLCMAWKGALACMRVSLCMLHVRPFKTRILAVCGCAVTDRKLSERLGHVQQQLSKGNINQCTV